MTKHLTIPYKNKFLALLSITFVLFAIFTIQNAFAEEKSEWVVYGNEIKENETITLNGNLTIYGNLTFKNVEL